MKRRLLALLLTAVMVFGMIPASLLPVLAHGIGVGVNTIENLSIDNAPNQAIPATVTIDGIDDDTAWDHDTWNIADDGTGIWDAVYYRSTDFQFKYQLHADYEYLYGIIVLDTAEIYNGDLGDITVWINDDETDATSHYTGKVVMSVDVANATVTTTRYTYSENGPVEVTSEPADSLGIEALLDEVTVVDGTVVTVEFRTLISAISAKEMPQMTAYVSVETVYKNDAGEVETTQILYHPRFDAAVDDNGIDPATAWPENAVFIEQREMYELSSADYSDVLPNEMNIDGKVLESAWAPYTTMYSAGLDRYEYRAEDSPEKNDLTGYNVVDFDTVNYSRGAEFFTDTYTGTTDKTDIPIKYKYDVRYDKDYLYGAVVAYADYETLIPAGSTYTKDGTTYVNVPLVLTIRFSELNADGSEKDRIDPVAVITNYTELTKISDNYYTQNNNWTGTCAVEVGSNSTKMSGGSRRLNKYLVEYEFQIPISTFNMADNTNYGYVLSVDTYQWGGSGTTSSEGNEMLLSGYFPGCLDRGDYFCKTNDINTENWVANGQLETGRWAAIMAADKLVDGMSRGTKSTAEHMAYEVFTDDNYLYGIAIIEEDDWNLSTNSIAFNLWINNGVARWHDVYDAKVAFSMDSQGRTQVQLVNPYTVANDWGGTLFNGAENMLTGVYNAAYSKAISEGKTEAEAGLAGIAACTARGFDMGTKTSLVNGNYAQKWLVHPTNSVYTQGVEAVMNVVKKDSDGNPETVLLEYKLPLEMLCISETDETGINSMAFTYYTSLGKADGSGGQLVHPMVDNHNLYGATDNKNGVINTETAPYKELIFYPNCWNARGCNEIYTTEDFTNMVEDGKLQEDYWDQPEEEMIYVDGDSGTWASPPQGQEHIDYYYRVYSSREWLYGGAFINDAASDDTKFTLWLNNDITTVAVYKDGTEVRTKGTANVQKTSDLKKVYYEFGSKATAKFDIYMIGGEPVCVFTEYNTDGTVKNKVEYTEQTDGILLFNETVTRASSINGYGLDYTQTSSYITRDATINYGFASMKTLDDLTYVEFKINLDKFVTDHTNHTEFIFTPAGYDDYNIDSYYVEARDSFEYCVSVTHDSNELYHLGGDENAMWVTHVNADLNVLGGNIVNDEAIFSQFSKDNFDPLGGTATEAAGKYRGGYAILVPTEMDNVYEVKLMYYLGYDTWLTNVDSDGLTNGDRWLAALKDLPEGSFIYTVKNTDTSSMPAHLKWSWNNTNVPAAIFDVLFRTGKYVQFNDFVASGKTVEEVAGVLSRDHIEYTQHGYYNKATFTSFEYPNDINETISATDSEGNIVTHYPDVAWTASTAYAITTMDTFVPEKIEIDGEINDTGWDDSKWISVSNDVNGNLQNSLDECVTDAFEYKYQLRTDGEYVYVAAVMDVDPDYTPFTVNSKGDIWWSSPQFRIWIQSEGEGVDLNGDGQITGAESYDNAISFTHLYDVRLGSAVDPNTNSATSGGNVQSSITVSRYDYTEANLPFEPVKETELHVGTDGVTVDDDGNNVKLTYDGVTLRFAEHVGSGNIPYWATPNGGMTTYKDGVSVTTTRDQTNRFGLDSAFWGENEVVTENTQSGAGYSEYQAGWYAAPEVKKYVYGNEHAAYNTSKDGTQAYVEFKFALSEINTDAENGFKYYVQCSSISNTTTNAFVLYHPHYTIEPDNYTQAFSGYHYPFWVWGDNAFVCDKEWFYENELKNPTEPVSALGGQYIEGYQGSTKYFDKAVRLGVLYTEEYLDDVYGRTDWTEEENIYKDATYWDVKEIGMMISASRNLGLNAAQTDVALYTETKGAIYADSDLILHQTVGSNMADYETYIFYAVVNTTNNEKTKLTYRGFVEYYPHDDIYYDHTWLPGATDNGEGWTFRPTYYTAALTRNYNMIEMGANKEGYNFGNGDHMPSEDDYVDTPDKINANDFTIAYIPLDDRPVNDQRVQYLAQSAGFNLLMPPEEYYTNTLDNNGLGEEDGVQSDSGNPLQLLNWLKTDAKDAHYYVLSLDMLFSGGLIGARAAEVDNDYDDDATKTFVYTDGETTIENYTIGSITNGVYNLSEGEQAILDYLVELAADESKYVVYFDTVMRLASTTYYGEYTINDYNALRGETGTGYAEIERKQLYGSELTVANIVAGYNYDADGNIISANEKTYTYADTYTTYKVEEYLFNRQRKLTIIDELLGSKHTDGSNTIDNIESLILGVDDSMPKTTIQTNELRYIEEQLVQGRDNTVVMAAADELGLLGISDVTTYLYGKVHVNLEYFGDAMNEAADDFDKGTLNDTTKLHINAAGGYFDYNEKGGLDVLVLTKGSNAEEVRANAKKLLEKAKDNLSKNIATCIVDGSGNRGILASYMFGHDFKSYGYTDIADYALSDVGMLMGYSEWNTVSNSLGIALSNAISRYAYLQKAETVTEESNYGFMKVITHAFVKDIAYRQNNTDGAKFYEKAPIITDMINKSKVYVGEVGVVEPENFTDVRVSDLYWPWDRHFEADFVITFLNDATANIALDATDHVPVRNDHAPGAEKWIDDEKTISARNADLNDGDAGIYEPSEHYNDNAWYEFTSPNNYDDYNTSDTERAAIFEFNTEQAIGLVRIHCTTRTNFNGIEDASVIRVYGADTNDESTTWTQIGEINPNTFRRSSDYVLPNGNSYPAVTYPFHPEVEYSKDGSFKADNGTVTYFTDIVYWSTVPTDCGTEKYKYIKVAFFAEDGNPLQWLNEIEIYAADAEASKYTLDCEKTNFPYVYNEVN